MEAEPKADVPHSTQLTFPKDITYIGSVTVTSQKADASGFYNELNQHQFEALQKFKQQLASEKIIDDFEEYDDLYLLRFLRARKFDLAKTTIMFKNFIKWRAEKHVDDIRENWVYTEMFKVKPFYPHSYHKTDKIGRPIYIEMLSQLKYYDLFKVTTQERLTNYYIKEYEREMRYRFPACSAMVKRPIEQSLTILDCKGIGLGSLIGKTREFLQIASAIGQDYYPEMLGTMLLLNTNLLFRGVWAIAKAFIDAKTAGKIHLLSSSYKEKVLELADAENVPSIIGGTCTCPQIKNGCLWSDIGPWNPKGGIIIEGEDTYIGEDKKEEAKEVPKEVPKEETKEEPKEGQ